MGTVVQDESLTTTNVWATIVSTEFSVEFAKLLIHIFETAGAQSVIYRVQASNDANFARVQTLSDSLGNTQWTIAASGTDFQSICDCWFFVRVQVTNGSGIGTARCIITGSN